MNITIHLRPIIVSILFFTSLEIFSQTSTKIKEVPAPKIGYVSLNYLLQQQPEFKDIQTMLTTKQQQVMAELKRLNEELQVKVETYQKEATQLSDISKLDREKELLHLQNRIQDFEQTAQKQIKAQSNQLLDPLIKKIQTAVNAFAKENNYRYVFNSDTNSVWPTLLYALEEDALNDSLLNKMGISKPSNVTKLKDTSSTILEKQTGTQGDKF